MKCLRHTLMESGRYATLCTTPFVLESYISYCVLATKETPDCVTDCAEACRHRLSSLLLLSLHLRNTGKLDLTGVASLSNGLVEGHLEWLKSVIFYQMPNCFWGQEILQWGRRETQGHCGLQCSVVFFLMTESISHIQKWSLQFGQT